MNVTRDTIIDLLPLYLSGEASPATQKLVREFLAQDAALAAYARAEQEALATAAPTVRAAPDLEATAFARVRRRLATQRWAFGLAWLFTALSMTTHVTLVNGHITEAHVLLSDAPVMFGIVLALAVACWLTYFNLRSRE